MSIERIMCKEVVSVEMDDPLRVVKEIFDHVPFHHLVVVDSNRKLCGVLTDRDLLKALSPTTGTASETDKDRAILKRKVHQIMTREPVSITPYTGIYEAVSLFNREGYSCIPVVNEVNKPIGMLSWRDIFMAIEKLHPPQPK